MYNSGMGFSLILGYISRKIRKAGISSALYVQICIPIVRSIDFLWRIEKTYILRGEFNWVVRRRTGCHFHSMKEIFTYEKENASY